MPAVAHSTTRHADALHRPCFTSLALSRDTSPRTVSTRRRRKSSLTRSNPRAATPLLSAAMSPPMTSPKKSSTPPSSTSRVSSTTLALFVGQKGGSRTLGADGGAPPVCRKFGKINHIVNNAGFTYDRMLHTTPDYAWDIIIRVHVRALRARPLPAPRRLSRLPESAELTAPAAPAAAAALAGVSGRQSGRPARVRGVVPGVAGAPAAGRRAGGLTTR